MSRRYSRPGMTLGRAIKWIEDRAENLIAGGHAREETADVSLAFDDSGTLLAGKVLHVENVGAYPNLGDGMAAGSAAIMFPGPYRMQRVEYAAKGVYSNTCGHCAYRGPWMMETVVREQMMDIAAERLGLDALDLRRRNVIQLDELPFTTATGVVYEAVSPAETLEQAAELIGYDAFRKEQAAAREEGRYPGAQVVGEGCPDVSGRTRSRDEADHHLVLDHADKRRCAHAVECATAVWRRRAVPVQVPCRPGSRAILRASRGCSSVG